MDKERYINSLTVDGRYRLLVEAVTDYAIYMLDPNGIVTSWNPGAERFKGYRADEIIGQHFSRFYTEEDRATDLPARALKMAAETGKFEAEGWRVRKDGRRFWAYVIIDPIRLPDGEIVGYAKVTRDLTERHAAEQTLQRSEQQFGMLVQSVTDYAIFMLDPNGRVANWNAGAERIKGYRPDEIVGRHFSDFYTPEDRKAGEPQKTLAKAAHEGHVENEGWRLRKDGTRFWAHVIIDRIRDDAGEIIGYAKITRDITERREATLNLERAREALFQSQKMEAIGQLTGGIAHDFNNLLMAVVGSLELMRKRLPDDPRLHTLLENAMQGAQRGATLTKRLLAFARRQELTQGAVAIPELVGGMAELLERTIGSSIGIATRFAPGLRSAKADANQLEMALLNLAVNARDAMPDGGQIVIAAAEENVTAGHFTGLAPGAYIRLGVRDTGTGMSKATLDRAVEPFFTTKGPGKGTGLGLSMVHGLAEQFGGRLTLSSRVGEGTHAELWLPIADESPVAADAIQAPGVTSGEQGALRVLAVDDDALVLTNTVAMLEDLGHTALRASSGREALTVLRSGPVDLVITDQLMPQMTGEQLAQAIAAEWPNTAIVLATGFAESEAGVAAGLPRLSKPFTLNELAAIVRSAHADRAAARVLKFPNIRA